MRTESRSGDMAAQQCPACGCACKYCNNPAIWGELGFNTSPKFRDASDQCQTSSTHPQQGSRPDSSKYHSSVQQPSVWTEQAFSSAGANHRTILIIGKVGVGKSTLANHILGRKDAKTRGTMEGVTRRAQALREIDGQGPGGITYRVKIVDVSAQYDSVPDQARIMQDLQSACNEPLNLVLFVVQRGRITRTEKKIFEIIVPKCPRIITSLIITNCEDLDDRAREEAIQDFKEDEYSKQMAQYIGNGVYTVGFPNLEKIKPRMREVYQEGITSDEELLQDIICKAKTVKSLDPSVSRSGTHSSWPCRQQ